jgi:hypothetical protein
VARGWWQLARGHPSPLSSQSVLAASVGRPEATKSKLARALVLGPMLAAMNLAGMTAVAQAQANDEGKDARRPPTERRVGESWRNRHVAPGSQTTTDPAAQRALARQRYWYYQSTLASRKQTAELSRRGEQASQEQTTSDAALRRQPARERFSIPSGTPAQLPAPAPAKSSGQPGWLLASLGVLAAVLALAGGLAVLAARRAGRRARVGHAA